MTSWDDIIREHGPPAYRVAWRILGHEQDCEDVLQVVFIEVHKRFVAGEVTYWPTFLNKLVTFRSLDALRRRKELESIDRSSFADHRPMPDAEAIDREEEERLRGIVAKLPPRQAAVFCLSHFEELSHEDIAATLEVSKQAVTMAIFKAKANLRELIAKQPGGHES